MTINTPDPYQDEPTALENLSREVFDLVDDSVVDLSDQQIDERLAAALAEAGYDSDLTRTGELRAGREESIAVPFAEIDLDTMVAALGATDLSTDELRMVQDIITMRAAAEELLQEARHARVLAERVVSDARQRAAEVAAKADAYLDRALDQAWGKANEIISAAERKAQQLTAVAEHDVAEMRRQADLRRPNEMYLEDTPSEMADLRVVTSTRFEGSGPAGRRFLRDWRYRMLVAPVGPRVVCSWNPPSSAVQVYDPVRHQVMPYRREEPLAMATAVMVVIWSGYPGDFSWQMPSWSEGSLPGRYVMMWHVASRAWERLTAWAQRGIHDVAPGTGGIGRSR